MQSSFIKVNDSWLILDTKFYTIRNIKFPLIQFWYHFYGWLHYRCGCSFTHLVRICRRPKDCMPQFKSKLSSILLLKPINSAAFNLSYIQVKKQKKNENNVRISSSTLGERTIYSHGSTQYIKKNGIVHATTQNLHWRQHCKKKIMHNSTHNSMKTLSPKHEKNI